MKERFRRVGALVAFTCAFTGASAGCGGSTDETTGSEDSGTDATSDSGADTTLSTDAADTSTIDSGTIDTMDSAPDADATTETGGLDAADASDATDATDATDAADAADATDAADASSADTADGAVDAADAADAADTAVDTSDAAVDASDAAIDAIEAGPVCTGDLSGIGTGDFRIAFRVTTTTTVSNGALLNQRSTCGYSVFWDVRMASGKIVIETDGGSSGADYSTFLSTVAVNDGAPHDVVLTRTSGVLLLKIDGIAAGTATSVSSFGSLPALATGTDVCIGVDGTVALPGAVTDVCISH